MEVAGWAQNKNNLSCIFEIPLVIPVLPEHNGTHIQKNLSIKIFQFWCQIKNVTYTIEFHPEYRLTIF